MPIVKARELEAQLAEQFHKKLLAAAMQSLADAGNPLAFNNFCTGYRELVRHVLNSLAPQQEIEACSWFVPDPTSKTGVTRGHRITYIIRGGLDESYVEENLGVDVTSERRTLTKAVDDLSRYVHVNPDTFGLEHGESVKKASSAIDALLNVLSLANECRAVISRSLECHIHDHVVREAISETIVSIDELATHHSIDEVYVDEIEVIRVDSTSIHIRAYGSIGVELQWGSNSDREKDNGAVLDESFPFVCELQSNVDSPGEVDVIESSLNVDTSSWWEGYWDEA